jgi:hypothetical protein
VTVWRRVPPGAAAAAAAAAVAAGVAALQLRGGIVPMLDTVTYWSGAKATASGRPLTTTVAASFSHFSPIEFLERGGRLPFVDFPVGYSTAAGVLAVVLGASGAMVALTVVAAAALAAIVVVGPRAPADPWLAVTRGVVAVGIVGLPVFRLVTQAALSEPLFCVAALGLVAAVLRYRRSGRAAALMGACATACGLLRFVGAGLVVLPALEMYRRERSQGRGRALWRAAGWGTVWAAPAAANALWGGAVGGGHVWGWRGFDRNDVVSFGRSVAGWFERGYGDARLTFFGADRTPSWLAWTIVAVWLAAVAVAVVAWLLDRAWLPEPLTLCLVAAGLLTAALAGGMALFDSLVFPDNRLMLPAGVLTLCGLLWSWAPSGRRAAVAGLGAVLVWLWVATGPLAAPLGASQRGWLERFSDSATEPAYAAAVRDEPAAVVLSNDADGVAWHTGTRAAYLPQRTRALTGETVDVAAEYAALPCALLRSGGVVVFLDGALLGMDARDPLEALVQDGRLRAQDVPGATVYRAAPTACR